VADLLVVVFELVVDEVGALLVLVINALIDRHRLVPARPQRERSRHAIDIVASYAVSDAKVASRSPRSVSSLSPPRPAGAGASLLLLSAASSRQRNSSILG
jgi:hypothetical protein